MPFWTGNENQNVYTPLDVPTPNPNVYRNVRLKYVNGALTGLADEGGTVVGPSYRVDANGNVTGETLPSGAVTGSVIAVASSRSLTAADNGNTLECTASGITLTIPSGVLLTLGVVIIPNGTTSVASSGGTLLNGATTTVARDATLNAAFAVIPRTTANSYVVTGN